MNLDEVLKQVIANPPRPDESPDEYNERMRALAEED
jgi:hypothetical protein